MDSLKVQIIWSLYFDIFMTHHLMLYDYVIWNVFGITWWFVLCRWYLCILFMTIQHSALNGVKYTRYLSDLHMLTSQSTGVWSWLGDFFGARAAIFPSNYNLFVIYFTLFGIESVIWYRSKSTIDDNVV